MLREDRATGLARMVARTFPADSELASAPELRVYLSDMIRPYEFELREDLLAKGVGHSYGEMGLELISAAVAEDEPVDLLLLALWAPDVRPGRATALYLSSLCPGRPQSFAISDQGIGAAFTATRLAREYLRTGECHRALVLMMEQSAVHYAAKFGGEQESGPQFARTIPDCHTGVAMRYEHDPRTKPQLPHVRQLTSVGSSEAGRSFEKLTEELPPPATGRVLVLGEGLADVDRDFDSMAAVVVRPAGRPLTGVWSALAEHHDEWASQHREVVLADYDQTSRTLNLCSGLI